ncbi:MULTISPECIES: hypothetical protein [unclassified Pseudonocardia]|uniref:hypothetical protein n=1 Tax=unclassified Pseudonocardia TaxID=2619320 RepID=UPI0001FFDBAA|nr:hypothetical protein [Pseudonocardia sp. Ae707_Ps1]OLM15854.1 putative glycosyl transferase [Pseudonocardia sp. Ae707_Ps1]
MLDEREAPRPGPRHARIPLPSPRPRTAVAGTYVLLGIAYLLVSLWLQRRVLADPSGLLAGHVTADADMFAWWLNWFPFAVGNGANPLVTDWMHWPHGLNALWNTAVPLLAALLAPVTVIAGSVTAFNVGIVLGPVVSGLLLVAALGPFVTSSGIRGWVARGTAGALYAFSPFHLAHAIAGHLNLTWSVLPPLLLLIAHHLFGRGPLRRPWLVGGLTGLALLGQLLLYTQTLAVGVIFLVLTAIVLALRFPRRVPAHLPGLLRAGVACVVVFGALGAYPIHLVLAGPNRPRSAIRNVHATGADLANVLVPTRMTAFRPLPDSAGESLAGHIGEQGGYVGVAMLALVVVAVLVIRSTALRVAAGLGALAWLASLGTGVVLLGSETGVPLPWLAFADVPLLSEIEPVRIQVVTVLCVAVVVAMWIDRMPTAPPATAVGALALTGFALVSWLPADAQEVRPAPVPEFFTTGAGGLGPADVVEIYPRITATWDDGAQGLRWQAASGPDFRIRGGYFIASDPDDDVVIQSRWNRYQVGAQWVADGKNDPSDDYTAQAHRELRTLGITAVAVVPGRSAEGGDDARVVEWTRRVTGDPGRFDGGVWLFRLPASAPVG